MDENEQPDRTKVTFSQAEGLEPLPEPLKLEELSEQARALLWKFIYEDMRHGVRRSSGYSGPSQLGDQWRSVLYDWHVRREHQAADDFSRTFNDNVDRVKSIVSSKPFNVVFDFLEFVMRHPNCPRTFRQMVQYCFQEAMVAYTVVKDGPTIMPAATPEEGVAIREALRVSSDAGLGGARTHLVKAGEELNTGNFADSVRESIHAVESVACRLNADAKTTLKPALAELAKHTTVHPALKKGFENIYGYTNDASGIRHALHEDKATVDREDAVFMLSACASFVTYLVGKARASGLIEN